MDSAGHALLARARFPGDKHRRIPTRHQANLVEHTADRFRSAEQVVLDDAGRLSFFRTRPGFGDMPFNSPLDRGAEDLVLGDRRATKANGASRRDLLRGEISL